MGDVLTWQEIERRYPDEWVLLDELRSAESVELTAGRVVFHSKDRDAADHEALRLRPAEFAVLFTGEPDPEVAFIF